MKPIISLSKQKKKLSLFVIAAIFSSISIVTGQELFHEWHYTTPGVGYDYIDDVQVDDEGNIIAVGRFEDDITFGGQVFTAANFSQTGFLLKLDSQGKLLWHIIIPVGQFDDVTIFDLEIGKDDEIILAGSIFGEIFPNPQEPSFSLNSVKDDALIIIYDKDGKYIRANTYAGPNSSERFFAMDQSSDGHLFAAGYLDASSDDNDDDAFLVRLDASGAIVWNFLIDSEGRFDGVNDIKVFENHFYLTGSFEREADFDPSTTTSLLNSGGGEDIFVAKYTLDGILVWAHKFGSDNENEAHRGRGLLIDKDENIYVCGEYEGTVDFNPGPGVNNLEVGDSEFIQSFVLKLNFDGEFHWVKKIDSDRAKQILEDQDGNLLLLGRDFRDLFFQKFTPDGTLLSYSALKTTDSSIDASSFALDKKGDPVIGVEFIVNLLYDPQDASKLITSSDQQDIAIVKLSQTMVSSTYPHEPKLTIALFPNPARKSINVEVENDVTDLQIYDCIGKQVLTQNLSAGYTKINTPFPPGVYFLHFKNQQARVVKKLQIL